MMAWILSLLFAWTAASDLPLIDAVKQKDRNAVQQLLEQRTDVNAAEGDGTTALHWAAYRNDVTILDLLLRSGATVNKANDLGITPLYLASANGNPAAADRLLKAGADTEILSESGVSPLMEAARAGNPETVKVLLDHEANVNAREGERNQTALMWAVSRKHPEVVKVLLERGADVHVKTNVRTLTVMDSSSRRIKAARDGAMQIEAGGSTALHFAAQNGDAESAGLLINAGANINETAGDGKTALVLAAFNNHGDVAGVLLEAGADPNAAEAGYTALHAAALRGNRPTVQALLAKGANPNVPLTRGTPVQRFSAHWTLPGSWAGATPLFVAAVFLERGILSDLLAAGADASIGIENGVNPLLAATGIQVEYQPRPSDVERFSLPNVDNPSVPRLEPEVVEAATILLDAGADVNYANQAGDTALHGAARTSITSLIQLLADRGANLEAKNGQDQTPLSLTLPRGGQRGGRPAEPDPNAKAAEELLRKLGATQ